MSKLNVVRRCFTCGAILQDTNKDEPGYISPEILEAGGRALFCNKCFEDDSYNLVPNEIELTKDFKTFLKDAQASDALVVYIVDLFSFEATFSSKITKELEGTNILCVATKRDLLPSSHDDEKLRQYVAHRLRVAKLNVLDVILASGTLELNIKEIVDAINKNRKRHDVYLVGAIGAGKTALITAMLKNFKNTSNKPIRTFEYPGTQLRVMQIPLDRTSTMFDSNGLSIANSMVSHVENDVLKQIVPNKAVEARNFKIVKGTSLFIGSLARFDFIENKSMNVACYFSHKIKITRTQPKDPDEAFLKTLGKEKGKPGSKYLNNLTDFNTYELLVDETGERDIGIQGLGWISFTGNNQKIRIVVPKGVAIYTTRAKINNAKK